MVALFEHLLRADESLFINPIALDYDFQPKLILFREEKQHQIARCIAPLLQERNGTNILLIGRPGVGKTVCAKHVLKELEEEHSEQVQQLYINCWKLDSAFKIAVNLCEQVGYTWTHNKRVDELVSTFVKIANKKGVVLVLDEADKLEDESILYTLLEDLYKKVILIITNDQDYLLSIDQRVKSRLMPEVIQFEPYTRAQTEGILQQRKEYAFVQGVWQPEAFERVVEVTYEIADIRTGLFLLRQSAEIAEAKSSRKISEEYAEAALAKLDHFKKRPDEALNDEQKVITDLIQEQSGKTSKEIFRIYEDKGGQKSYRTFQRYLKELQGTGLIALREENRGFEGRTTIVEYRTIKKLDEFSQQNL